MIKSKGLHNKLIIISGISGAGKTSVFRSLMNNEIVSMTTRPQRVDEVKGRDYDFTSKHTFQALLHDGLLVEHSEYDGNFYGLTKSEIEGKLYHAPAFVVSDFFGMLTLRKLYPNSVTIFMYCDQDEARNRLLERGDSPEKVNSRISTYHDEMINRIHYDYVIKNQGNKEYIKEALINILRVETGWWDLNDYSIEDKDFDWLLID